LKAYKYHRNIVIILVVYFLLVIPFGVIAFINTLTGFAVQACEDNNVTTTLTTEPILEETDVSSILETVEVIIHVVPKTERTINPLVPKNEEAVKTEAQEKKNLDKEVVLFEEDLLLKPILKKESIDEHDQEFKDRCRLTYAESSNQEIEGMICVAAVTINRETSELFPDDFYGVMNEKGQFEPVRGGEIYHCDKILSFDDVSDEVILAVERALRGEDPTEQLLWDEAVRLGLDPAKYAEGGALFFCRYDVPGMENIRVKIRIGAHVFFKVWG